MKILVAYDGTLSSRFALIRGILMIKKHSGILIIILSDRNLLEEDSERFIEEVGSDIKVNIVIAEGNLEDEIVRYAKSENVNIVFSPKSYNSIFKDITCPVLTIPHPIQYIGDAV